MFFGEGNLSAGAVSEVPVEASDSGFPKLNVDSLKEWISRREVQAGALIIALVAAAFWSVIRAALISWFNMDSYYQHGPLVPFAVGYLLYANRDRIQKHAVRPTWKPLPILMFLVACQVVATWAFFPYFMQGVLFMGSLLTLAWIFYGFRRAWAMTPALLFSVTGLPIWNRLIDENTNNLQIWSTDGAYLLLNLWGLNPFRENPTSILLDNFPLQVAAACSGMKLTLALFASILFIMLLARLKWWGNLILIAMGLPLAVAINALRIAIIGVFGDKVSSEAGYMFHDYGSYLTLILAFWILYVTAKKLGWKV